MNNERINKTKTYTPANQYSAKKMLQDGLAGYREGLFLARLFVMRDFKAKYKTSYIGFVWELAPAISTAVVWIFLRGSGAVDLADTGVAYPVFVLIGTMMWAVITESMNKPLEVFRQNSSIITKINIPKEALLLIGFFNIFINLGVKLVLVIFLLVFFQVMPSFSLVYFIPMVTVTVLFFMGIGVLLMPLEYMLPDIARIKQFGLMGLMYLTPVVYGDPGEGVISTIMQWNPLSYIIEDLRNALTGAPIENGMFWGVLTLLTVVVFLMATLLYRVTTPIIVQRISA